MPAHDGTRAGLVQASERVTGSGFRYIYYIIYNLTLVRRFRQNRTIEQFLAMGNRAAESFSEKVGFRRIQGRIWKEADNA